VLRRFRPHRAAVLAISVDDGCESIGSASIDGTVSVASISTTDVESVDLRRPARCVALDPEYSRRSNHHFVTGGMAGKLILHERGWLGQKEVVLHSGESPVWAASWRTNLIAWATDEVRRVHIGRLTGQGVRVLDASTQQRVAFVARSSSLRADIHPCSLVWASDRQLIIGWADSLTLLDIRDRPRARHQLAQVAAAAAVGGSSTHFVGEVAAVLELDCMIAGVAAHGAAFLVLAYPADDEAPTGAEGSDTYRRPVGRRPELRLVTADGEETSADGLNLPAFERYSCADYKMAGIAGDAGDPVFHVLSPADLLVVRARDAADHVTWLLERERFAEALEAIRSAGSGGLAGHDAAAIGRDYLSHLIEQGAHHAPDLSHRSGSYDQAARVIGPVLGADAEAWESYIFLFAEHGRLGVRVVDTPR